MDEEIDEAEDVDLGIFFRGSDSKTLLPTGKRGKKTLNPTARNKMLPQVSNKVLIVQDSAEDGDEEAEGGGGGEEAKDGAEEAKDGAEEVKDGAEEVKDGDKEAKDSETQNEEVIQSSPMLTQATAKDSNDQDGTAAIPSSPTLTQVAEVFRDLYPPAQRTSPRRKRQCSSNDGKLKCIHCEGSDTQYDNMIRNEQRAK
jgi:hypothetical protein